MATLAITRHWLLTISLFFFSSGLRAQGYQSLSQNEPAISGPLGLTDDNIAIFNQTFRDAITLARLATAGNMVIQTRYM